MESKIMFLIIAILALYLIFSEKGQMYLRKYVGLDVSPVKKKSNSNSSSGGGGGVAV